MLCIFYVSGNSRMPCQNLKVPYLFPIIAIKENTNWYQRNQNLLQSVKKGFEWQWWSVREHHYLFQLICSSCSPAGCKATYSYISTLKYFEYFSVFWIQIQNLNQILIQKTKSIFRCKKLPKKVIRLFIQQIFPTFDVF